LLDVGEVGDLLESEAGDLAHRDGSERGAGGFDGGDGVLVRETAARPGHHGGCIDDRGEDVGAREP